MDHIEIYVDDSGEYRWRYVRGGNNEILAQGEGYKKLASLRAALDILFPNTVVGGGERLSLRRRGVGPDFQIWWP